jgi:hypothetical protein
MSWLRHVALVVVLGALGWGLAASSAIPVAWHASDAAMLRLSWVARPERIDECRILSDAELADRPAHMRQARECRGASATYRMRLSVDGEVTAVDIHEGGGLRKDRAIFVLDEYALSPGRRHIVVQFSRVEPSVAPMDSASIGRGAVARELRLDTTVTIAASTVALVSLVDGRLHLRQP